MSNPQVEKIPSLEDIFVASVQAALETAFMLGMNYDQFISTLSTAWVIDHQRRNGKKENTK